MNVAREDISLNYYDLVKEQRVDRANLKISKSRTKRDKLKLCVARGIRNFDNLHYTY